MKKPERKSKGAKAVRPKPVEMMGPAAKKAAATKAKTFPRFQAGKDRGGFMG